MNTETKPRPPVQIWILCAVLVLGLIAQYIGGEAAFALLKRGPLYSAAASALIEAMAMAEAFTLAMSYRARADDERDEGRLTFNPFALGGLVVSLGCSGIYNFVWVKEAVPGLEPYQVAAYAIGPLAALSSAGLTLGTELREYLMMLTDWTEAQEHQVQARTAVELARQAELAKQERDLELRIKYERAQAEIAREAERVKLEAQEITRATKVQESIQRKELKLQEQAMIQEIRQEPEIVTSKPEISADLPEWLPEIPKDKAAFVAMVRGGSVVLPEGITGAELAAAVPTLKSDRNGRNWLKAIRNGKDQHDPGE
jgi:hypothetical protein